MVVWVIFLNRRIALISLNWYWPSQHSYLTVISLWDFHFLELDLLCEITQISERTHVLRIRWDSLGETHSASFFVIFHRYLNVPTFWASGEIFRWDSLWYFSVSLAQISERTHVLSVRWDFPVRFTMILLGESQCVESRWDFSVSVFQDFPGDSFVVILGESFSIFHCECFVNLSLWVHVEFDRSGFC